MYSGLVTVLQHPSVCQLITSLSAVGALWVRAKFPSFRQHVKYAFVFTSKLMNNFASLRHYRKPLRSRFKSKFCFTKLQMQV